jgi:hypothetical protein
MEVMGITTGDQWRTALDALQLSPPFFSVRIEVDDDKRPCFRQVDGSHIPIRVLDERLSAGWEAEMAKEVSIMVSGDHAPFCGQSSSAKRSVPSSSSQPIIRLVTQFP